MSDGRTITLQGVGPKCPECSGPTYLVTESPQDGQRPWWCPACNTRVEDGGRR